MGIHVSIVTPERMLFDEEVDMVTLPGEGGQMGILENHVPLLSTLAIGEIILHTGDEQEYLAVSGGIVEVRPDKVTILADVAENPEDIDEDRAKAALERAQESLADNQPAEHRAPLLAAVKRSNLRLKVARRKRSRRSGYMNQDN